MLNTLNIRHADAQDAFKLAAIGRLTFVETFAESNSKEDMHLYVQKAFTIEQLKKELDEPNTTFLIAYDGDKPVGYAKLRTGYEPPELKAEAALEIERIYVRKAYLGKNVGKQLMQMCLSLATEQKFKLVWLGVWEHNPRAIKFYEKWGFEKFGSHPFILGFDAQTDILMKKKIN
jgi:diamine N-acetyltransferase